MSPEPNDNNTKNAIGLLRQQNITIPDEAAQKIKEYMRLIREWNEFASLVSKKDLDLLENTHLPDALSLAPVIHSLRPQPLRLLDIGSGGGFPAVPLKLLLPRLQVELVERNAKKAGFLETVTGCLQLEGTRVIQGNFPQAQFSRPDVITARAIEKPKKIIPEILNIMPAGSVFLCQAGRPETDTRFHVEPVEDIWGKAQLRRGQLWLVRRL